MGGASIHEAMTALETLVREGARIALLVVDSRLAEGEAEALKAVHKLRTVVPTARRMVTWRWENFREDAEQLRPALAKGKLNPAIAMLQKKIQIEGDAALAMQLGALLQKNR